MDKFIESFSELAGEFKKLKEENDEWRQVCDDFDTPDEVEIMIDDLKECVKELKEENESLKKEAIKSNHRAHEEHEENKKLQEEFDGWKASYDDDIREARAEGIDELQEENERLKEENEELKKERDHFKKMGLKWAGVVKQLMSECGVN